jgi:hypothetical protein
MIMMPVTMRLLMLLMMEDHLEVTKLREAVRSMRAYLPWRRPRSNSVRALTLLTAADPRRCASTVLISDTWSYRCMKECIPNQAIQVPE